MSTFRDRAPRLDLSFPLELHQGNSVTHGHCLNLSESGLLGTFHPPLDLWTKGELLLRFGERTATVPARVVRSAELEAGLAFAFRNDAERQQVRLLLEEAAAKTQLVGLPPF